MARKPKYLTDLEGFSKEWGRLVALRSETKKHFEFKNELLFRENIDMEMEKKAIYFAGKSLDIVHKEPFNSASLESEMKLRKPAVEIIQKRYL